MTVVMHVLDLASTLKTFFRTSLVDHVLVNEPPKIPKDNDQDLSRLVGYCWTGCTA